MKLLRGKQEGNLKCIKCLDAKGQNVAQWEAEIDQIVARLYGLTDAERAIIEGKKP